MCVSDALISMCFSLHEAVHISCHLCRNWASIHERKHVVIHLPSLGLSEGQRQGLSKPQVRENSQMARLCDLADPLVELLYVAPFALPEVRPNSPCTSQLVMEKNFTSFCQPTRLITCARKLPRTGVFISFESRQSTIKQKTCTCSC